MDPGTVLNVIAGEIAFCSATVMHGRISGERWICAHGRRSRRRR